MAKILAGKQDTLFMGNLDAKRDWGFAKDYVEAMWLMLQQPTGDDFVIATGETHSVREFLEKCFGLVNLSFEKYVRLDEKYLRPTEVDLLIGDPTKAATKLNWKPRVSFDELVRIMLTADLEAEGLDPKKFGLEANQPGFVP